MTFLANSERTRAISQQGTQESLRTVERGSARSFRDRVAATFKASPNTWISAEALMQIGGRMAWRTRVSNCRKQLGMEIENRQRHGEKGWIVSEYRYLPPQGQQELGL